MIARPVIAKLWTCLRLPITLFVTGFAMMGDPVEGGQDSIVMAGSVVLAVGLVILFAGFWHIFRKRSH